jgi:glycosyltransferase involved in cell wall biosynthesis
MVLRQHNVEHVWMARYAAMRGATPAGWYARIQAERLRRAEARLCRASALVLAIQDEERETLRRLAPQARIETLPVGVDLGRFREPSPVQPPIVLIAGSFGWPPNEEGARRFLKEGWPLVRRSHPDSRLRVAGKDISESLARSASDAGAEVAGYVESMPTEFSDASVLVVPLWVGAGARVKIVESLAAGLPVVSTTVGVEGLGLSDGTHYLRADTPVALAAAVSSLLATAEKRTALSSNGRRKAQETWSLEAVARLQNRYCEEVATP